MRNDRGKVSERLRRMAAIAAMGMAGVFQGCTCSHSAANLLGRIDAPVRVELVKKTLTGPRLFGSPGDPALHTSSTHVLRIDAASVIEVPVLCNPVKVDVSVAKSLDRVAYRCNAGEDWTLTWIGSSAQFVVRAKDLETRPATTPGEFMDANALAGLVDAAPELLTKGTYDPRAMFLEVERLGGRTRLATTLAHAVKMPPSDSAMDANIKDAWLERRDALPAADVAPVDLALRQAIESPRPGSGALLRAVRVFDGRDSALADVFSARLREIDSDMASMETTAAAASNRGWDKRIWGELIHRLMESRPALASEMGCGDIAREPFPKTESLVAIARGKTPCPALGKRLEKLSVEGPCSDNLSCTGFAQKLHLCTPQQIEASITAFVAAPYQPQPVGITPEMALVAAGRALGVVPKDLALRLDRALYAIDMPSGPDCRDAPSGRPCHCNELAERPLRALCKAKPEANEGDAWECSFRMDDATKRVTNVVSAKRK